MYRVTPLEIPLATGVDSRKVDWPIVPMSDLKHAEGIRYFIPTADQLPRDKGKDQFSDAMKGWSVIKQIHSEQYLLTLLLMYGNDPFTEQWSDTDGYKRVTCEFASTFFDLMPWDVSEGLLHITPRITCTWEPVTGKRTVNVSNVLVEGFVDQYIAWMQNHTPSNVRRIGGESWRSARSE